MSKAMNKTIAPMPSTINTGHHHFSISHIFSNWRAYYDITKPKVVALLVLTALVGMSLSVPGGLPWQLLLPAMLDAVVGEDVAA